MLTVLAGLGLGLSLIVAIGAQNVFVLRQGLRREHVLPVVLICALSDAVLIVAGVAGLGFLIGRAPWLIVVARVAGALFLIAYGLLAARRAWRGGDMLQAEEKDADGGVGSVGSGHADSDPHPPGSGDRHSARTDLAQSACVPRHRADAGLRGGDARG
nr:LysE family transporter [Microbacterium sp. KUDC0406]